jgi:hypothetical protein
MKNLAYCAKFAFAFFVVMPLGVVTFFFALAFLMARSVILWGEPVKQDKRDHSEQQSDHLL